MKYDEDAGRSERDSGGRCENRNEKEGRWEVVRVMMVIPTYWARERSVGLKEGDAIYDHPTPLDNEGTLLRALKSIRVLNLVHKIIVGVLVLLLMITNNSNV